MEFPYASVDTNNKRPAWQTCPETRLRQGLFDEPTQGACTYDIRGEGVLKMGNFCMQTALKMQMKGEAGQKSRKFCRPHMDMYMIPNPKAATGTPRACVKDHKIQDRS